MKVDFNKHYTTIAAYTVITFSICLLLVVIVQKFSTISGYIKTIADVLAPITWGIAIAYIVNPIMMWTERLMKKIFDKEKPHPRLTRGIGVAVSLLVLLIFMTAIVAILLPQIIESIMSIANSFPTYITNIEQWAYKFFANYPDVSNFIEQQFDTIQPKLMEFVNNLIPQLANLAVKLKDGAVVVVLGLKDFVIGFIVAIYLLCGKEKFIAQMRKVVNAIFPQNVSKSILNIASHTNLTLGGFISGKLLDSLIIGIITFISMTIMKMDFVALISVVVGVTNVIPFFGPFIGAIPSALLLLVASPKQVIPFVIFIIILQQFDGNILGPKILGDSTGLSAFWVMFAIFIGGGLFGFAGMLLGVPVFAVIYSLISDFINYLLSKKGLSTDTGDYYGPTREPKSKGSPKQPSQLKCFTDIIKRKAGHEEENKKEETEKKDEDTQNK